MAVEKPRVAILASGSGTTAEAFIEAAVKGLVGAEIGLVICNKPESEHTKIYERVRRLDGAHGLGIRLEYVGNANYPDGAGERPGDQTIEAAREVGRLMRVEGIRLGLMMGYLNRARGDTLLWPWINTHPAILPLTAGKYGKGAHKMVLENKLTLTEHTVHWVDETYDTGMNIARNPVHVYPDTDSWEDLAARVQSVERTMLPLDVDHVLRTDPRFAV